MGAIQLPAGCSPEQRAIIAALTEAAERDAGDPQAALHLGNALYEAGAAEAVGWWEKAAKLDRENPAIWRNLGLGYFNVFHDVEAAKGSYQKTFRLGGFGDARVLYERDQVWRSTRERPEDRLAELEKYPNLIQQRDALTIEYRALLNQTGQYGKALEILRSRRYVPWEGGAGCILAPWSRANIGIGRQALWRSAGSGGDPQAALVHFQAVLVPPENLGETWPPGSPQPEAHYWAGLAARATGAPDAAHRHLTAAADTACDFPNAALQTHPHESYWAGLALRELGRPTDARRLFEAMLASSQALLNAPVPSPRPLTSLSATPPLDDDPQARQMEQALLLEALARHGLNGENGADRKTARRLLTDILRDNPSHPTAADLLVALDWMP